MTNNIDGQEIVEIREMTEEEYEEFGFLGRMVGSPRTLVLENGARLMPAADPELNGPGAFNLPYDSPGVEGATIHSLGALTEEGMEQFGWGGQRRDAPAIILTGGPDIVLQCDAEGNAPGHLIGITPDGETVDYLPGTPAE